MQAFRGGDGGGVGSIMGEPKSTEYFRREDGDQGKIEWFKTWVQSSRRRRYRNRKPGPESKEVPKVVDVVDEKVEIEERVEGLRERRRI
jgi:hypothetical protein